MSPSSGGRVMVNEGADEVGKNVEARKSFVAGLRRSPRFGESWVKPIIGPNPVDSKNKSIPEVKGGNADTTKEMTCLRRSARFSNQQTNYKDADQKLYSTVNEICCNDNCETDCNSPIGLDEEFPRKGKEPSFKNEVKEAEPVTRRRKRIKEGSEVMQGWTHEQEMILKRAYMTMKPTPRFWNNVSKMVGKSAQECFDRINYDAHTPVPPRIRSRLKKKMSPLNNEFSMSASKLLESPSRKPARKRKTQLGQKKVRELLRKQCNIEKEYEGDLFSVLEGSSLLKVSQHAPVSSTSPVVCVANGSNSFSAREKEKCVSKLGNASLLVSPPVLKQVRNKELHEKYIDQLHIREAKRRAELTRAKKATFGKENLAPPLRCNQICNEIKAAKDALESDVKDVILQFQLEQAKTLNSSPSKSEDDILLSCDEIEDEM